MIAEGRSTGGRIWDAADGGDPVRLGTLLRSPVLRGDDVNFEGYTFDTPLYRAVRRGAVECVRMLLAHPYVDVNLRSEGLTALDCAVTQPDTLEALEVLKMLCVHPLLKFDPVDRCGITPLWRACHRDNMNHVRVLLASAPVGTLNLLAHSARNGLWDGKTTFEVTWHDPTRELLKLYSVDPAAVRCQLREAPDLGLRLHDAASDFASVVLLSDDFLSLTAGVYNPARQFLAIIARLPMELQMSLCHRRHGSGGLVIMIRDTDQALKRFALQHSSES